jgi:GNAT superfamily N-acetyltransferase
VGWRVTDHKRLYRHAGPPRAWEPPSSGLAVRPWRLDDDGAALVGHADGLDRPAALRLWSTLLARGAATNPKTPEGWFVAESRGRPVAFALPGWLDAERRAGTNLFLGVMPEWRGAGLGTWVQALVVQSLRAQGALDVLGSTNHDKLAMQRVFERTGYRPVRTQRFLRRR